MKGWPYKYQTGKYSLAFIKVLFRAKESFYGMSFSSCYTQAVLLLHVNE